MARAQALGGLRGLAEGQGGLFTRAQALASGVSDQTLARHQSAGRIRRVAWGVYRLPGELGCYERVRAAWLQLDASRPAPTGVGEWPAGVVSHLSPAAVFDLCPEPDQLTFTVPISRRSRRHDVRFVTAPIGAEEWTWWEGLPVARPPRIVVDLLAEHQAVVDIARLVERALQRGLTSPAEVGGALASVNHLLGHLLDRGRDVAFLHGLVALAAPYGSDPPRSGTSLVGPLSSKAGLLEGGQRTRGHYPPDRRSWQPSSVSAPKVAASVWGSAASTSATAAWSVTAILPAPFAGGSIWQPLTSTGTRLIGAWSCCGPSARPVTCATTGPNIGAPQPPAANSDCAPPATHACSPDLTSLLRKMAGAAVTVRREAGAGKALGKRAGRRR